VFIQVDYEASVDRFEETASGGRVRQQLGDHVAVGGTYVQDDTRPGSYELGGVDAEFRIGKGSEIVTEYADSTGTDALSFVSDDGGVSYRAVPGVGTEEGSAFKVAVDLDIGEWFGAPERFRLRAYFKELDPGFSSSGNLLEQGTRKTGVHADWNVSDTDAIHLRHFQEELDRRTGPGVVAHRTIDSIQWNHEKKRWGFGVEFRDEETEDDTGAVLEESQIGAARWWSQITEKFSTRLEHQESFSGRSRDQSTLGVEYRPISRIALDAEGTHGSRGDSVLAGFRFEVGETEIYVRERLGGRGSESGSSTIVGAKAAIGPSSQVYTEYQWDDAGSESRVLSVFGIQKTAGTVGLSYDNSRGFTVQTRNDLRLTEGTARERQFFTFNQIDYRVHADWSVLARYRYSKTTDRDLDEVLARFEERVTGLAYRPVRHDRFNALARYTRLKDQPPVQPGALESITRTVDVLSLETIFEITPRFEWISKLAARRFEEDLETAPAAESESTLFIQHLNMTLWRPVDFGIEYRWLDQKQTDDTRQGWLTQIMWNLHENFRIGGGYNFTDFSDNMLSRNDYSVGGWFFRIQGRY
jgi:hypothetical protein